MFKHRLDMHAASQKLLHTIGSCYFSIYLLNFTCVQQGNDPKHTSRLCQNYLERTEKDKLKHHSHLTWTGQS